MSPAAPPLTAIVPCSNNAGTIAACLESVRFAAELLVVDAFSTDGTAEIAGRIADRVLRHAYRNYAAQNSWAIPQARHDWVLIVDSDERVTPELAEEIRALFARGPAHRGYWIPRRNFLFGREIRHSGWGGERVLRLFHRGHGRYRPKRVHAGVVVANPGALRGAIVHESVADLSGWVAKIDRYSSWKSEDKFQRGAALPLLQMVGRPPLRFAKDLLLRRGFLDGWRGVLIAGMSAWAEFLTAAKLLERRWRAHPAGGGGRGRRPGGQPDDSSR